MDGPEKRLQRVAKQIVLRVPDDAVRLESWSNDAWMCHDAVLRICFQGDPQRLVREAAILGALPDEVRAPEVLEVGEDGELSWMVVRRVAGEPLWERWKTMPEAALRPLVVQVAGALRALHEWWPPEPIVAMLREHEATAPVGDAHALIGHDLLPLPLPRHHAFVATATQMPFVDPGMVREAGRLIDDLASAHDPFVTDAPCVVHGDLNLSNVMADGVAVTALIDFEWARLGSRDAELVSWIRAAGGARAEPAGYPPITRWLADAYPELFSAPDLRERVWLTELAYALRQLVAYPPSKPVDTMLPALLDGPWRY